MIKGARCSGSTSVSKTEGAGSIPAAPAKPVGYCAECGTIVWEDFLSCEAGICHWIERRHAA